MGKGGTRGIRRKGPGAWGERDAGEEGGTQGMGKEGPGEEGMGRQA